MHMESRETVLMNLFAGKDGDADVDNGLWTQWRGREYDKRRRIALATTLSV